MNSTVNQELRAQYHEVLESVLNGGIQLPSMPDVAINIRKAVQRDETTCDDLANIIEKDPGLVLFLLKAVSSPVYRRAVVPKTLHEVVNILGFSATASLVMMYCTQNLVELKNDHDKELFLHSWQRLVTKTAIASFLSRELKVFPVDRVQLSVLLTEIGALSVLSAVLSNSFSGDKESYFALCRDYARSIGYKVLEAWEIDDQVRKIQEQCGDWDATSEGKLGVLDIANLALYHAVISTKPNPDLPPITELAAYGKLSEEHQELADNGGLALIGDNDESIQEIIASFG